MSKIRVHKLTNGELIIGESVAVNDGESLVVDKPYSIYETPEGMAVMPYEFPYLMEPMESLTLRMYDVMWNKKLEEFTQVHNQYKQAIGEIVEEIKEKIIT